MNEEVHIPISIKETAQDNSTPSISQQDNSDKETAENFNVLQTDKSQQELKDIGKDTRPGIIRFFTKSKAKDSLKASLVKTEEENVSLKAENIDLKISIDNTKHTNSELKRELDETQNVLAKTETEKKSLEARNSQLVEELIAKNKEVSTHLRCLQNKPTEITLRARFTGISKLTSAYVYSQSTELAGIYWRIYVYKNDDSLAFFIQGKKENAEKWSCSAITEYQLISMKSGEVVKAEKWGTVVHTDKLPYGHPKFISFKNLFDEEKGYVKDDAILLAAVLRVFPTV